MGKKTPERKRARKEEAVLVKNVPRKGVSWRSDSGKYVVEMRPPNWKKKLNFGSYDTEDEAMVARDYGAFLRAFALEKPADAGGFDSERLYHFEELREIFEDVDKTKARRKSFLFLYQPQSMAEEQSGNSGSPIIAFCKEARRDILDAMQKFRKRYPGRLAMESLPKIEPVDGGLHCTPSPSSNAEARVSRARASTRGRARASARARAPGRGLGDITGGSASASAQNWSDVPVQIAVAVNGSPLRTWLDTTVLEQYQEEAGRIIEGCLGDMKEKLNNLSFEKILEMMEPCSVDPLSIPVIKFPSDPAIEFPEPEK